MVLLWDLSGKCPEYLKGDSINTANGIKSLNYGIVARSGETVCQDAVCVNETAGKYAVADGVSTSFFPKIFAEKLVNEFCLDEADNDCLYDENTFQQWLARPQGEWYEEVSRITKDLPDSKWHITKSFLSGEPAGSTLVGLEMISSEKPSKYRGVIIGDSCFFHIRDGQIFRSYLVKDSEAFGNFTESFASYANIFDYNPSCFEDTVELGDILVLGTDKISEWIFKHSEALPGKWKRCLRWLRNFSQGKYDLENFVKNARNAVTDIELVNDDVGLIVMTF